MKVKIKLTDNNGDEYEGDIELKKTSVAHKSPTRINTNENHSRKKQGTVEKILSLGTYEFFKEPKTIKEIIEKLAEKDFHFRASDLTLPLRKIVRSGKLKKTKDFANGQKSKIWMYVKE
ncbi:hypothetical protein HYX08_00445 [Candidatus Woesearchaeota archaeon]|nr:hypothetical protein [Candidatus Woesearchaeota archaeon]